MRKVIFFLLTLLSTILFPSTIFAQVVINEIAVQPSDKEDWVELYSIESTDISGWILADESGDFYTFPQGTNLVKNSYISVSKYQRLNNDSDTVYLYDSASHTNLINSISYGEEGEVCVSEPEGSLSRLPDGGNTVDRVQISTKDAPNNVSVLNPCPSPTPLPTITSTPSPKPSTTSPPTSTPRPSTTQTITPSPTAILTSPPTTTVAAILSDIPTETGINYDDNEVLLTPSQAITPRVLGANSKDLDSERIPILAFLLVGAGVLMLVFSLTPIIRSYKSRLKKN